MLFDIRGKRRHVVRVVYAILAILMGASLFLVVGPLNVGELFGGGSSTSTSDAVVEQAERAEAKLRKAPDDPALLLRTLRAQLAAGNALVDIDPETGIPKPTQESREEYEKMAVTWQRYRKATGEAVNPSAAQLAANTYWTLAESSSTFAEAEANIQEAAKAQEIYAKDQPSLNSLSTLAKYALFSFQFAKADKIGKEAAAKTRTKEEKERLKTYLEENEKQAHGFQKRAKAAAKEEEGRGKEALANPLSPSVP